MKLTEFLLERIAEREAPTYSLVPYDCPPGHCAPAGWVGAQCRYCDSTPVYGGTVAAITQSAEDHAERIHQRSRVLAECAAQREVVRLYGVADSKDMPVDAWVLMKYVLGALAAVYADHPDYPEQHP